MIRTNKDTLRKLIRLEYAKMAAQSGNLSKKELQELGRLIRQRGLPPEPPPSEDPWDDMEATNPGIDPVPLGNMEDLSTHAADTQTDMRTIDIVPNKKRPFARRSGLEESNNLQTFIKEIVKKCDSQWCLYSHKGKKLGTHETKEDAYNQEYAIKSNS